MDSQKAQRVRIELQTLKMTWPEIDEYISKFESIAHEAGYNPADHKIGRASCRERVLVAV